MRIYFAGMGIPKESHYEFRLKDKERKYRFLYSYLEIKNDYELISKYLDEDQRFLDSGAYSAFTLGKVIDINDYIRVIKDTGVKLYANLDVIGNWGETNKNQEYMESKGLKPLPTFHFRSPFDELKRLINKYGYIALGGLVPISRERGKMQAWLDSCFSIIKDRCRTHAFGVNSIWAWKRYPFYSVDATSWVTGSKFRKIVEFKNGDLVAHEKMGNSERTMNRMRTIITDYKDLNISNILEYQKMADFVTRMWENRGIIWED